MNKEELNRQMPIGVFDSGVGGLTVAREIMRQIPNEKMVYFGDTARTPYGSKSRETVIRYSRQIVRFLQTMQVKAIVVACNTASAYALDELEKEIDIPVIGVIKPGAKVAAEETKNGKIGVIGTEGTIGSGIYTDYIRKLRPDAEVIGKACPLFVPLVEEGLWQDPVTDEIAMRYLSGLIDSGIDTLVLGCTHYPLIRSTVGKIMGEGVRLVNPAYETARELKEILRPVISEREVGRFIRASLTANGATGAFATCQSGARSREPYPNDGMPCSDKLIEDGDMVHMEINGFYNGYQIDVCRSTVVGAMSREQERILNICLEMLEKSVAATRPGIRAEELEAITGEIAVSHGLAANHTAAYGGPGTYLGHAIGLGVDEPPCLARGDKTLLVPGMVLTIEPGIYRTEWGGCRIEDEVLVTQNGHEVLNVFGRRFWE